MGPHGELRASWPLAKPTDALAGDLVSSTNHQAVTGPPSLGHFPLVVLSKFPLNLFLMAFGVCVTMVPSRHHCPDDPAFTVSSVFESQGLLYSR